MQRLSHFSSRAVEQANNIPWKTNNGVNNRRFLFYTRFAFYIFHNSWLITRSIFPTAVVEVQRPCNAGVLHQTGKIPKQWIPDFCERLHILLYFKSNCVCAVCQKISYSRLLLNPFSYGRSTKVFIDLFYFRIFFFNFYHINDDLHCDCKSDTKPIKK